MKKLDSMNIASAKNSISKLVEKYEYLEKTDKLKNYNEENTKNEFIEPLLEALGCGTLKPVRNWAKSATTLLFSQKLSKRGANGSKIIFPSLRRSQLS